MYASILSGLVTGQIVRRKPGFWDSDRLRKSKEPVDKFCRPHLERTGKRIPAAHVIDETPMCKACFAGKAIFREEALPGGDGLRVAF